MRGALVLAGAGLVLLSGCSTMSPNQAAEPKASAQDSKVQWQLDSEESWRRITVILESEDGQVKKMEKQATQ
jgi:uncharacterized protein YceK